MLKKGTTNILCRVSRSTSNCTITSILSLQLPLSWENAIEIAMPVCISPSQTTKGFTQHERRRRNSSLRRRLQAVANIVQLYASLPKDHTTKLQQKCLPNCNIENASLQKCNTIINPLHFDFDSSFQPFFAFIKFSLTTYGVLLPQRKSNTTCPGSSILPSITRILADTPTSPTGLGLVE